MGGQGPSPFGVPLGGGRGGATFLILMGVAPGSRVLRNSLGEVGEVQPPSSRETVEVAVVVAAVIFSQDQLLLVLENSMETEPQVLLVGFLTKIETTCNLIDKLFCKSK